MLAETRARSAALINQSRELHLQSKGKRRETAELRIACTEAGLACRAAIQRSNLLLREARTETRCDPAELACMIANALARCGFEAFIAEPDRDTALTT